VLVDKPERVKEIDSPEDEDRSRCGRQNRCDFAIRPSGGQHVKSLPASTLNVASP
jgi:hypothetical protein